MKKTREYSLENERIALAAAEWYFCLKDSPSPVNHTACANWRAADERHELAWKKIERINQSMALLPADLAMKTLARPDRRRAIKSLALLVCIPAAGWLMWKKTSVPTLLADQRTHIGERRRVTLDDGTSLHLNTDTAIGIAYTATERLIRLQRGEILIETAPDSVIPARPFRVQTEQGIARALGTRFTVRDHGHYSHLSVYEGAVEVMTSNASMLVVINAGEQTRFSKDNVQHKETINAHGASWAEGMLVVRDMPLADFIAELGRYRPGLVRCTHEVSQLKISGAYQLDNTDKILANLPQVLPVNVIFRSRYWVTLVAADAL